MMNLHANSLLAADHTEQWEGTSHLEKGPGLVKGTGPQEGTGFW